MIDWELDSDRVQVAMSLQGHTLKSRSKYRLGSTRPARSADRPGKVSRSSREDQPIWSRKDQPIVPGRSADLVPGRSADIPERSADRPGKVSRSGPGKVSRSGPGEVSRSWPREIVSRDKIGLLGPGNSSRERSGVTTASLVGPSAPKDVRITI